MKLYGLEKLKFQIQVGVSRSFIRSYVFFCTQSLAGLKKNEKLLKRAFRPGFRPLCSLMLILLHKIRMRKSFGKTFEKHTNLKVESRTRWMSLRIQMQFLMRVVHIVTLSRSRLWNVEMGINFRHARQIH